MHTKSNAEEWKYISKEFPNKLKCNLCGHQFKGTLTRARDHLLSLSGGRGGGVHGCLKITPEIRDILSHGMETSQSESANKLAKKQRVEKDIAGSYSSIASASACNSVKQTTSSATLKSLWNPIEKRHVDDAVGDFFYANGIPFNVARSPYFRNMIQQVVDIGKGSKPPSCEALRTTILQRSKERLTNKLESIKETWKHTGCTIISDGWSDMKHRPLINVLVYSPQGVLFVKAIDAMDHTKTSEFIFKILEEAVLEVGEENAVQIVTDSASNCVGDGNMIMERFKTIYWTPCIAHCMDLLLHDLGKLPWVNEAIQR